MGIALKANMLTALILVGFAFGGQPLVGYNYGAKNEKRLKEILKFAYLFEMGTGLGFAVLVSIFAPTVIRVFMNDPGIVNNGAMMLRYQQIGMMFMAVTLVSTCVCQSVGNASGALGAVDQQTGRSLCHDDCCSVQNIWIYRSAGGTGMCRCADGGDGRTYYQAYLFPA